MSPELINTIGTIAGVIVAALGAFLFAFWIAMGIWAFHDIRQRTRDWLVIILAVALVLIFPLIGLILYMMIRPKATLAEVYDRALEEEALLRELEQTAACHNCGVPVKEAWVYCPNCHNQLQHSCPTCGNLVRNEWEICVYCGSAQQRTAPQLTAAGAMDEVDVIAPSRFARRCLIRLYAPADYPDLWRAYFASKLGLGTIPKGEPGETEPAATGTAITTSEQLARWMKAAGGGAPATTKRGFVLIVYWSLSAKFRIVLRTAGAMQANVIFSSWMS